MRPTWPSSSTEGPEPLAQPPLSVRLGGFPLGQVFWTVADLEKGLTSFGLTNMFGLALGSCEARGGFSSRCLVDVKENLFLFGNSRLKEVTGSPRRPPASETARPQKGYGGISM